MAKRHVGPPVLRMRNPVGELVVEVAAARDEHPTMPIKDWVLAFRLAFTKDPKVQCWQLPDGSQIMLEYPQQPGTSEKDWCDAFDAAKEEVASQFTDATEAECE